MVRLGVVLVAVMMMSGRSTGAQDSVPATPYPPPFNAWLEAVRTEALARGIRAEIVEAALTDVQPVEQILERDRTQAEFTLDFTAYLRRRLTRATIRTAQRMMSEHRALLHKVDEHYGVPAWILTAVWGLESNFGRFSGVRPTIPALATLAYDPRRAALFRNELFSALEILNRGDIELAQLKGSWAGALGQPQFMPSAYLQYAQDFDGDGRRDIWTSQGDVFASVANYLKEHGWAGRTAWGREVRVPSPARAKVGALPRREIGCRAERAMTKPMPLKKWSQLGVRNLSGGPLPAAALDASLVTDGKRYFLVYRNYEALLAYNCATSYALSVGLLSDRLK